MKVEVTNVVENEDGSANVDLFIDDEFIQMAVQYYIVHLMEEHMKNNPEMVEFVEVDNDDNGGTCGGGCGGCGSGGCGGGSEGK